jgi:hypothetical protein
MRLPGTMADGSASPRVQRLLVPDDAGLPQLLGIAGEALHRTGLASGPATGRSILPRPARPGRTSARPVCSPADADTAFLGIPEPSPRPRRVSWGFCAVNPARCGAWGFKVGGAGLKRLVLSPEALRLLASGISTAPAAVPQRKGPARGDRGA